MSTTINLNTIGKDMDWTWPYRCDGNDNSVYRSENWSDIRIAYQNLDQEYPSYWTYDEMHPNGICMYEKLPKVSTSNDPENSVWVPLVYNNATSGCEDANNGNFMIVYYLVPTSTYSMVDVAPTPYFWDTITVYTVDGLFDHAILNESSSPRVQ